MNKEENHFLAWPECREVSEPGFTGFIFLPDTFSFEEEIGTTYEERVKGDDGK